ncbi:MAG: DUF3854 domain-containing protein [Chloroflexota bacterium]|nr:DUF3854 domain-containing protein [Chloroflexota bacterium]
MSLSELHLHALRSSAVSDEVSAERGYDTVTKAAHLERLGFGKNQRRVPAMLLPVHGFKGGVASYQIRPDTPRVGTDGRLIKYETPRGSTMVLDVHPQARVLLADPAIPLFITEGIKKGDALVSKGACAVALLGVWNWRGTNEPGGKTALVDWEYVALNGRRVFIVFDSDVMTNPAVYSALSRLGEFLKARGAN